MATSTQTLDFEKPIVELEKQIDELKRLAGDRQMNVAEEIAPLERKLAELREQIYRNLTPWQRVQVARNPRRPFTSELIDLVFTDFIELHWSDGNGSRARLRSRSLKLSATNAALTELRALLGSERVRLVRGS